MLWEKEALNKHSRPGESEVIGNKAQQGTRTLLLWYGIKGKWGPPAGQRVG